MAKKLPATEIEFAALMERIDQKLTAEGYKIPQRPIHAVMVIGTEFAVPLPLTPPIPGMEHPSFEYWWVTKRILQWYDHRYGDRLKIDFAPGRTVILLRGESWIIRLPRIYGHVKFVLSRAPKPKQPQEFRTDGHPIEHNVLDSVEGLPDGQRESFTDTEMGTIGNCFLLGFQAFTSLREIAGIPLVASALSDISASIAHITASHPDYAQSKWSSLEAAEKLLKATIETSGHNYPRTHDLDYLVRDAKNYGIDIQVDDLLPLLRCTPSIRYGQQVVKITESVSAHHACLELAARLAPLITERENISSS